ncbi:MarR family winged helix-turn-helix transcriptional regulator [Psychrilyobacter atlanticus]|uniref:MarR family winged helix-turn-helix transcriptional regulator n=1 Tax=Psychrilyobacter atlanticus TaxID=271091 RepID=UPI00041F233E|nr:MarR family transcriptional regulator [Psychrilyobacter atlanticus]
MEDYLKLDMQLCFKFYKISRSIIRAYKPLLEKLGLTYPQYLAMLVMWEYNEISFSDISKKLDLKTGTLSPMLKKLEKMELIERVTSDTDCRKIMIGITKTGLKLKIKAESIPLEILKKTGITMEELKDIKAVLQVVEDKF